MEGAVGRAIVALGWVFEWVIVSALTCIAQKTRNQLLLNSMDLSKRLEKW